METNNNIYNQNDNQPKKSKVLLYIIIYIALIVLAFGGYYLYKYLNKKSAGQPSNITSSTTSVPATSTSAGSATTTEIAQEIKSINVSELKQAVKELKETISSFSR